MILYARAPGRAAVQALSDAVAIAWLVAWVLVARAISDLVNTLAAPANALAGAGTRFEESTRAAAARMGEAPVIGARLREAMERVAHSGADASHAGTELATTIHQVGVVLGAAVAVGPILALLIPWLWTRARFVRHAVAVRRLRAHDPDGSLLALRALARQPLGALARVGPDPAGAWRRGEPDVVRALAELELVEAGLARRRRRP